MGVPTLPVRGPDTWTDIQGLANLRRAAARDGKSALPAVARQFEAVFTRMMIKSMRDASMGGGIMDSPATQQWRSMFDNQIALSLADDGRGLGVAAMLVRQLGGQTQTSGGGANPAQQPTTPTPASRAARTLAGTAAQPMPPGAVQGSPAGGGFLHRALEVAEHVGRSALHAAGAMVFSSPGDFVKAIAPYARNAARELGVSVRAVVAQAALETGWGKHMPQTADGASSNNLFGIKAGGDWNGGKADAATVEFDQGVARPQDAAFRAYTGLGQSFADYTHVLTSNPRYAAVLGHGDDVAGFAHALHRAGYATDPDYASKLATVANSDTMRAALAALKDSPSTPKAGL